MKIGIIANTSKENVYKVVSEFVEKLRDNGFEYILSDDLLNKILNRISMPEVPLHEHTNSRVNA